METAPLKSFATWARTALIRDVTARIAAVLAPGSSERIEQPSSVAALDRAIAIAGSGDKGRSGVADKVAYIWFNRIIALRFMDANGYTDIGVVSPQAGVEVGQPEILAEAKRGVIDTDIVSQKTRITVQGLLDGTRVSGDPQGEAYALLLADYCRHWNRVMTFMFEREGDYTELLIPANVLADDSVLNRSVKVLTGDVCNDVEVIGWLYQFYISERKDEVFAEFKKNKKAGADEIPAATQLFTPHWIVRYLVENSLGRLWMLNRPPSDLVNQMDYYIAPVDEETDFLKITKPEELKIIDPACGSGHMLTYAFDLLYAIYEEEGYSPAEIPGLILANNLYGTEIDPRAGALAAFALTMKARARQRTFLNKQAEPNIRVLEPIHFTSEELDQLCTRNRDRVDEEAFWNQFEQADTLGSLIRPREDLIEPLRRQVEANRPRDGDILATELHERAGRVIVQAEYLTSRYHVVIANPPYMGLKNMDTVLSGYLADRFPDSKADLMTAFMERSRGLAVRGGYWGMINFQSWMFLGSFERLRSHLLMSNTVVSLVHLGRGMFGSDFGTVAFVFANRGPSGGSRAVYRRLFDRHVSVRQIEVIEALFLTDDYNKYVVAQSELSKVPGSGFAYWLSSTHLDAFSHAPRLSSVADARVGLQTGDNDRFVRHWFEVSRRDIGYSMNNRKQALASGRRWFPYNKGGDFRRWYGNQDVVVNWAQDGTEIRGFGADTGRARSRAQNMDYYFLSSVSWSKISASPAFRYYPAGFIFDVAGTSLFAPTDDLMLELLAYCNSPVARSFLEALSPTVNFEVGHIAALPVRQLGPDALKCATRLVELAKVDWDSWETSWDFTSNALLASHQQGDDLSEALTRLTTYRRAIVDETLDLEATINDGYAQLFDLQGAQLRSAPATLWANPEFRYGEGRTDSEYAQLVRADEIRDLVSFAVGCMLGRYSLDEPGLILADQGETLQDYLAKVPIASFMPDGDNVIPIVDGDWFEDDIVARFRQFLRAAFGEHHFEENLRFVTASLGVKNLRDYFVRSFYKDHVQRYKKRPIYWLFSSPKGSFTALIYMHRYTPSTVSTVLNEYLREFQAKLKASLEHAEWSNNAKEGDQLRKILLELDEYEHDVLYPLATQTIFIDLDDGVKANYPKFGDALKKIPGLEASE